MKKTMLVLAIMTVVVAACSSGGQETSKAPPKHNVFESQTSALDKAKGVEGTIEESAKKQREAIEKSVQ